jgi:transcription initiation factor TFIID TATA-box-binding protein
LDIAREPVTKIRIENIVASTSLADELDLSSIVLTLEGCEYEPEQFPGAIYRLKEPKTALLLFRSGKLVCTGAKSLAEVEESVSRVAREIRKSGQRITARPKIDIQNIVASSDLRGELDLNAIAVTVGLERVEYEPEQFPGLVYRMDDPRTVILLFGSGKLVCTGGKTPADVERAVKKITHELRGAGLLR